MTRPWLGALARGGIFVAFFLALVTLAHWWQAGFPAPTWTEWLALGTFPFLLWLYLRHVSVLGCQKGCRSPDPLPPK